MSAYLALRLVHILSATLLFGTGLGTAFFMHRAWRSGDPAVLRHTARQVVLADWCFTLPSVIVQPVTGVWLMHAVGYRFDSVWFAAVSSLYLLAGAAWVAVVRIQYRVRGLSEEGCMQAQPRIDALMRTWSALGAFAFSAVLVIFALMVFRPGAF
jgi:uncharacterized membrane protein